MTLPLLPLMLHNVPPGLALALGQEGVPFVPWATAVSQARFVIFDSRLGAAPPLAPGQHALDLAPIRGSLGADPCGALIREDAARFAWRVGPFTAAEYVSAVDKRAVRRKLLMDLRAQLEQFGGVWLCVGAFPFPFRSAFNFRFDHDACLRDDLRRMLSTIQGYEHATSHFVCGAAFHDQAESLSQLRGLDVGAHGYWHHTYRHTRANIRNIARCQELLGAAGLDPEGFVAPHGRYNDGLRQALNSLGVAYSSEFALCYDDFPFVPQRSRVLQVPVHPVSLGIVLEAAQREGASTSSAVESAAEYFADLLRQKHVAGEPMFLYGHPDRRLGRYPQVLKVVFAAVDDCQAVWKTTLREFVRWWRVRSACAFRVFRQGDEYLIAVDRRPRGFTPAIEFWRGDQVASLCVDGPLLRINPGRLAYQKRVRPATAPAVRLDEPHTLRKSLCRYLDWEKVTPPEELEVHSLPDLLKKTLRLIRR